MGRAIVRDPKVFLFDEPLSNLDAKLRVQMRTEIKELHQRLKTTTIYVTHDQVEAMTMADKIVVMQAGRIEQMGTPLELFDRPANVFVAGFIGSPSMNMLKGRVEGGSVRVDGASLPFSGSRAVSEGQEVLYGVRPEHFDIAEDGLPARISVVEPTGSETTVVLRFGESEIVALFRERHDFKPGDTLHLKPRKDLVHLFDPQSGRRI
jgi:multiple sugar transport system ATP-binding protein